MLAFFDIRQGKLKRLDYLLLNTLIQGVVGAIVFVFIATLVNNIPFLISIVSVGMYMKTVLEVRRLRDMGWNPWIALIGVLLTIPFFLMMFLMQQNHDLLFEFHSNLASSSMTMPIITTLNLTSVIYGSLLLFKRSADHNVKY